MIHVANIHALFIPVFAIIFSLIPSLFLIIIHSPYRLKVGEVKTYFLFFYFRQIEGGAWFNMIDVPPIMPIIIPYHSGLDV